MANPEIKNHDLTTEEPLLLKHHPSELINENRKLKKSLFNKKAELEILQNQFSRLENLAAIGANGATVAHELNNPLTIICAEADEILDFLQEKTVSHSLIELSVQNIKNSSHRMRRIINHFQTPSNETTRRPWRRQNLTEIIEKSVDLIKPQLKHRNIIVSSNLQKDLPEIWGESSKLESILQNLLLNAMDAFLTVIDKRQKQIFVTSKVKDNFITITVRDTGSGISQNLREQIFIPFFSTKKKHGTGLGLAIVAGYVKEHNGQIYLNSEVNTGTEFILQFPLERRNGRGNKSSGG